MHPLLARQLRRLGLDQYQLPSSPEVWGDLLGRISQSYVEADQGHALLERSLALSSKEMQDLYAQLQRTSDTQLAQERNKLQAVLHSLGDGLCVVDSEWKIQMINHPAALMFGAAAPALMDRPVYRMISPGPQQYRETCLIADATFPPLASGESYRTDDGLLVTMAGQCFAISLVVTPMFAEDKVIGAVLVFRDIGQHKQVERERQQTEDLLRRIQTGLSELAKSPQVYGGVLQDAFRTITRVAAESLHADRTSIWFFSADRSSIRCADLYQREADRHSDGMQLSADDYPRYFRELETERIVAADDARQDPRTAEFSDGYLVPLGITSMLDVPIRCEGNMAGVICHEHIGPMRHWTLEEQHFATSLANTVALAIEAADRRKAEEALRTSQARLTMTVQSTNIGIWDWDPDSNLVYVSPEWKRQLGYEDHEIDSTFQVWEALLHPDDRERAMEAVRVYVQQNKSHFEQEYRLRHKHGSYRWILARGTRIEDKTGHSRRIVGVHIDVSDQKSVEEALRQAKDAAEAASLAKSQFLANMSHEIRTPMNGVLGLTELLLGCDLGDKARHLAESVHRSGATLLEIINDILDFSKIEAGKIDLESIVFDVQGTIREAVDLLRESARRKGLALICRIQNDMPTHLVGDPTRLRQVVLNLAGNAVKFTDQGHVEIAVGYEHSAADTVMLDVMVQDTGIGIPEDAQAHIFDAFAQSDGSTTRKYGGTGLGLAIVKQLVTLMEGDIEVQSQPGAGATFRFTALFKRGDGSMAGAAEACAANGPTVSEGCEGRQAFQAEGRILLVEDNPVNREVACGMLDHFALRVDAVETGQQAVDAVAAADYMLVLMDCQMPEMDGFTATAIIRDREQHERKARLPIIALTAHAMTGDRESCLAAGMDDYLAKPFTLDQLERTLSRWIPMPGRAQPAQPGETCVVNPVSLYGGRPAKPAAVGEAAGEADRSSIVDRAAFAGIRMLQRPGQPDILMRVLSQYLQTSPPIVATLRQAVLAQDADGLRRAAHRLKSSSAQLGAVTLSERCRDLEAMGLHGDCSGAAKAFSRFERDYAAVCAVFNAELAKERPST